MDHVRFEREDKIEEERIRTQEELAQFGDIPQSQFPHGLAADDHFIIWEKLNGGSRVTSQSPERERIKRDL